MHALTHLCSASPVLDIVGHCAEVHACACAHTQQQSLKLTSKHAVVHNLLASLHLMRLLWHKVLMFFSSKVAAAASPRCQSMRMCVHAAVYIHYHDSASSCHFII